MKSRFLITVALCATMSAPLAGQSLFNAAGMGLPVEPLDGRARALGSLGIGLHDGSVLPTDPGSMARLLIATGVMAGQPSWVDYSDGAGGSGDFQGSRFPLMGIAYPVLSGMMSIQIGSFLDQHFASETPGNVTLAGVPVATIDRFDQDGAVSNINIGYARMVGARTGVGITFGRYAGSVVRTLRRSYDDTTVGVDDYVERGKWSYSGHAITAGASSDLNDIIRVAASVDLPTNLDATASDETTGGDGSFDLPIQIRAGATARLSPAILLSVSGRLANWSSVGDDLLEPAAVSDNSGFGVGIELSRARLLGKDAPLRFGFRRTGLPFGFNGAPATERIFSAGFGLDLNRTTQDVLLAGSDFALERGRRSGGGVTENFWRLTLSLIVAGI